MDLSRTEMLIGKSAVEKLKGSTVAVFGLGGVGSYVVEGLVRSGIGRLDLIDFDTLSQSNVNRQLIATSKTIGQKKTSVAAKRCREINPDVCVNEFDLFFNSQTESDFDFSAYDYVVDAIDTVTSKILLVERAKKFSVPIISCMGTGNKLSPLSFEVADIFQTSVCPLARVMRSELKKRGIEKLKVVYSKEPPICPDESCLNEVSNRRQTPASISFVPSVAGLVIASEVVKDLIKN